MRPLGARLERREDRWHVCVLRGAEGAAEAVWVSLGGCRAQLPALRLWLALLGREEGR